MKDKTFLKDTLAFIRYIHNDPKMTVERKYSAIVSTLGHDLNGLINEDTFFSPRVTGYSKIDNIQDEAEDTHSH